MPETKYTVTRATLSEAGYENFSTEDLSVAESFVINSAFDETVNNIELHIYSTNGQLLYSNPTYRNTRQLQDSNNGANLYVDPEKDVISAGFDQGSVVALYNFLNKTSTLEFFVQEISADRTELKVLPVNSNIANNSDILELVTKLKASINKGSYFQEFRLNFNNNDLLIGVNIDINDTVIVKLYEALPSQYSSKSRFTFTEIIADSIAFNIEAEITPDPPVYPTLRSANFNLETNEEQVQPTEYFDYNALYSYDVTSSLHGVISQLSASGVELSIDYTDYSNFIHFSSAEERLRNFNYKMGLLEEYNYSASISTTYKPQYDNLTKGIISKFDDYEKYLYFKSGSKTWPKTNSNIPYKNETVVNSANWLTEQLTSASLYDELSNSRLVYTVPEFIREDSANAPYSLFLDMIGQHFDNLWIYSKAMTDKYNADNRLDAGVSKDLIRDVLRSFGVKLYSSNFSISNLAASFIGEFYQSGSEQINTFVTASNDPTPDKDILSETYKRIYHNLPYLIKTKGTERGLRALINCFGIPSGSLEISVFGGTKRLDSGSYFGSTLPSTDKIRLDNTGSLVTGNTLSQYISIQQPVDKYTQDQHIIQVGFSPANYINNYIIEQFPGAYTVPGDYAAPFDTLSAYVLGNGFNIDDYIGDIGYNYSSSYHGLSSHANIVLANNSAYGIYDFVRLIKFFDNQLFKMIKDFVPARDNIITGITIKPHILNRSKVKSPSIEWTRPEYSGSINTAFITGLEGGVISSSLNTAYTASYSTKSGSVGKIIDNNSPLFNGEFNGTNITVTAQSLTPGNLFLDFTHPELTYSASIYTDYPMFISNSLAPGEIRAYYYDNILNNPESIDIPLEPTP